MVALLKLYQNCVGCFFIFLLNSRNYKTICPLLYSALRLFITYVMLSLPSTTTKTIIIIKTEEKNLNRSLQAMYNRTGRTKWNKISLTPRNLVFLLLGKNPLVMDQIFSLYFLLNPCYSSKLAVGMRLWYCYCIYVINWDFSYKTV